MTDNPIVTSSTTGVFTAKVQNQRDFSASRLNVFFDGETFHISGQEGDPTTPDDHYRTIYIHVKKNGDNLTFHKLFYIVKEGPHTEKISADDGTFTINFDEASRHYRMSFHVLAKLPDKTVDILGSFDLRQS
ncbi:hypothetical protein [Pseudomonas sp. NPDC086278]|uniref:hypothetical protein n=1 Tax=Pseudomonas sp. NPDC086278 TaxID=3390646 RepID=UPI003D002E09